MSGESWAAGPTLLLLVTQLSPMHNLYKIIKMKTHMCFTTEI